MKLRWSIGFLAVLLFAASLWAEVSAQDAATPEPAPTSLIPYAFEGPFAPSPELCTVTPISTDLAASLLATPVAIVEPPTTSHGTVVIPAGTPADSDTTTAILDVLTKLWACNNASNRGAILGLFTNDAIQSTFGFTEATQWDLAELRANVAAALTPGEPRAEDEWASIDGIASVLQLPDGRIGVLVLNTDPGVANGHPVLDYFVFVLQDNSYRLDEIILDPFDLTPDYGWDATS
jgi:hypothetical protein